MDKADQELIDAHFSEWVTTRQKVEDEISDRQTMFCICGRLATGLHESSCQKLRREVDRQTLVRLKKSIQQEVGHE